VQLQKSVGDVWPRISSANALQKERSGSSERGPSSERRSAGDTVDRRVERNDESRVGLDRSSRSKTGARPRVTRDRHPAASSSPKAVWRSWDRGCKGHRILRRVPADGRHLGSPRGVVLHGAASTVVSAVSALSDPFEPFQKKDGRPGSSAREGERGVRVNRDRDRDARGSIASSPREENARVRTSRPQGVRVRGS
jgi:hypothetical protein